MYFRFSSASVSAYVLMLCGPTVFDVMINKQITGSPELKGVLCAIICPLILTLDPCRGPIGD